MIDMPVKTKKFEFGEIEIEVRQASGLEKLPFEAMMTKAFRKFRHFGADQTKWIEAQAEEFMIHLDELGAGTNGQILDLVPKCILTEGFDANSLTSEELRDIFIFVRGGGEGDEDGAAPLD